MSDRATRLAAAEPRAVDRGELAPAPRRSGPVFCWALLGILLLQAAWALTVPPFRGSDEHEHAYKAAAVARGDWSPHHDAAPGGWGELVTVPADLVVAARGVCLDLTYTTEDNCGVGLDATDGDVRVASSASRYNPAFYAVIGAAALPFDGAGSLYAMRLASMVMCAVLLAAAFTVLRSWARSGWMPVAFLVALTPVTAYSTAIAAPNGVELAAAFLLWSALLGLSRPDLTHEAVRRYATAAAVAAVPLAVVRTLGPLWLVLIVATCALLIPRSRLRAVWGDPALRLRLGLAACLASFGPVWTLLGRTNQVTGSEDAGSAWSSLPQEWVLWFLQSVAAFPLRNEPAPAVVYALALAMMLVLAVAGWRRATRRARLALVLVVVATTLIAGAVTVAAFPQAGPVWQGRYSYPYAAGFLLICGAVLDGARREVPRRALVAVAVTAGLAAATQVISLLPVLERERAHSPLSGTSSWLTPSAAVVVGLVAVAYVCLARAGLRHDGSGVGVGRE